MNDFEANDQLALLLQEMEEQFPSVDVGNEDLNVAPSYDFDGNSDHGQSVQSSNGLESAIQNQRELMYAMSSQLALAKLQAKKAIAQRENVSEQFMKMSSAFDRQTNFLQATVQPMKERQAHYTGALQSMEEAKQEADNRIQQLTEAYQARIESMKSQLTLIETKCSVVAEKADLYNLNELLNTAQAHEQEAKQRSTNLSQQLASLREEYQKMLQKNKELETLLQTVQQCVSVQSDKLGKQTQALTSAHNSEAQAKTTIESLQAQISVLKVEHSREMSDVKLQHDRILLQVMSNCGNTLQNDNIEGLRKSRGVLEQKCALLQKEVNRMHRMQPMYHQQPKKKRRTQKYNFLMEDSSYSSDSE